MRSPSTARARISVITGYSEPTTETMLSAPFVLATRVERGGAAVQRARGDEDAPRCAPVGGRIPRAHAKSASAGTGMMRDSTSSHSTESSAAASDSTK